MTAMLVSSGLVEEVDVGLLNENEIYVLRINLIDEI